MADLRGRWWLKELVGMVSGGRGGDGATACRRAAVAGLPAVIRIPVMERGRGLRSLALRPVLKLLFGPPELVFVKVVT
jgi:hypothetical protein